MKILFNCTVNVVGGAVQNAANFIRFAVLSDTNEFVFLVSRQVSNVLVEWGVNHESIYILDSPARSKVVRLQALLIERDFSPDVVYTMAGPTYIKFSSTHVMGISDPYITHGGLLKFFFNRNIASSLKMIVRTLAKGFYARISADRFVFQTQTSADGFCRRYCILSENKIFIIPNAIGEIFIDNLGIKTKHIKSMGALPEDYFYLLCPSAYYSHKDIEVIFKIAKKLAPDNYLKLKFILTINDDDYKQLLIKWPKAIDIVLNVGPYSYAKALDVYSLANAVILPSILETFSTTYIEAIALKLPLIVANEPFSKEVCGNYPLYFKSGSSSSLMNLLRNQNYRVLTDEQLHERDRIIEKYGTQKKRYQSIISVLESFKRS